MRTRQTLALIWVVVAGAYAVYGWVYYAGLFRWAAEQQLARFGEYNVDVTLLGSLFVLLLPAVVFGGFRATRTRLQPDPAQMQRQQRRTALWLIVIGLIGIVIGGGSGWLGYQKSQTPPTFASFAIDDGSDVRSTSNLVKVTGVARTDMIIRFTEKSHGMETSYLFVPLVEPAWQPAMPVAYFLKTNRDTYMPSAADGGHATGQMFSFAPSTPPFRMTTEPSALSGNDLPGPVQAAYERAGIKFGPTIYVVDETTSGSLTPYWIAAVLGIIVGFCLMLGGAMALVMAPLLRRRRLNARDPRLAP